MNHTFIVNTENVNEFGYRVLTEGIETTQYLRNPVVLYYHERVNHLERGSEVIGRVVKLYIEDKKLLADVEFDIDDEFAAKIAGKVERGFIRMASMYADVLASSAEPELLEAGQVFETVTKCKLIEISIVDIGGNDDALKLSRHKDDTVKLKKLTNNNIEMSHLKTIALALGKDAETGENELLTEIKAIALARKTADETVVRLQAELKGIRDSEATSLVGEAIELGLIPDALKTIQLSAFDADFEGQKVILSKLIDDKKADNNQTGTHKAVREVVLAGKGKEAAADGETFDFLQKNNVVKLQKLKEEDPTQYKKLHDDYLGGVRHTGK